MSAAVKPRVSRVTIPSAPAFAAAAASTADRQPQVPRARIVIDLGFQPREPVDQLAESCDGIGCMRADVGEGASPRSVEAPVDIGLVQRHGALLASEDRQRERQDLSPLTCVLRKTFRNRYNIRNLVRWRSNEPQSPQRR